MHARVILTVSGKTVAILRLLLCVLLLLAGTDSAFAGAQRMGIAAGSYRIAPHGSSAVPAFCFDFTRDSPTPASKFDAVLTGDSTAVVKVGGRTLTLQQAISQGIVQVRGSQATFAEVMGASNPSAEARMSPADRQELTKMRAAWKAAPTASRAEFERRFARAFPGDHTKLSFSSNVDQPIEITLGKTALLGGAEDRSLVAPNLQINGSKTQVAEQHAIWRETTKHYQSLLLSSGYPAKIGGAPGLALKQQIARFQKDHNLPVNGSIDPATERRLEKVALAGNTLKGINSRPDSVYAVLYVSPADGDAKGVYQIVSGMGSRIHATTIDQILKPLRRKDGTLRQRVYLVPAGLSSKEIDKLATSARLYTQGEVEGRTSVGVLAISDVRTDSIFQHATALDVTSHPIVEMGDGAKKAYEKVITFKTADGGQRSLKLISSVKELLERLVRNLQALVARSTPASPAQLLVLAIEQTRKEARLTRAQMAAQLRAELSSVQMALDRPSAQPVG